jgi:hypothetical protein
MNISHCNHHSTPSPSSSQEPNKQRARRQSVHEHTQRNVYSPQEWRFLPLSKHILKNGLSKNYFSMNMNLDNYDSLIDLKEHM